MITSSEQRKGRAMKVISISSKGFDSRREEGSLLHYTYYKVQGKGVAWSPDSMGFVWYDTLAEAQAQHG
jgi:hypothetical protein